MLFEKIIFNVIAFTLFILIFFKMIRKNDTNYVMILVLETLGIAVNFLELIFDWDINIGIRILMYVVSAVIPLIVLIIESKGINFSELAFLLLNKVARITKNDKKAKAYLITLVTKYPDSYMGHKLLAEAYEKEGGMRKAIDEYVKVIELNKKDYNSYFKISFLLNELGKKDESITMLNNLISKKPDNIEAVNLLGDILCEQERYKEALNVYSDILKYYPNSFEAYYNMGMVYTLLNDFANAKTCYEKAATINTLLYNARYNLGEINLIYGDLEEAEKYFSQCLSMDSDDAQVYFHIAKMYMLRNDKENAIKFVNTAIEIDKYCSKEVDKEPLFIPIKPYINFAIIEDDENPKNKKKLTSKEIKVKEHLEKTYKISGKISNNEIKKVNLGIEKNLEENENDREKSE